MNIVYLLESTALCGGVKVVFNHVSALEAKGHRAAVFSPDIYPSWFKKKVAFHRLDLKLFHRTQFFHDADVIMATSPFHLMTLYQHFRQSGSKKKLIHFVQGYEGDCAEGEPFMEIIKQAYSLDIPKIAVSEELCQRIAYRYPGKHYMTCGQGLENDIFYPSETYLYGSDSDAGINSGSHNTVFLIGAFDISIKRIADGLCAFKKASKKKNDLKLIRVSAVDTRAREEDLVGKIDEYHVNQTPQEVGELFRKERGVLISSSSMEGFGLPPLEAMACGIPTVLTDIPSYRAFSSAGGYALFVPVGNPEKMADALLEISGKQSLRLQLVKRGLAVAAEYSYSKVIKRLEACLYNV